MVVVGSRLETVRRHITSNDSAPARRRLARQDWSIVRVTTPCLAGEGNHDANRRVLADFPIGALTMPSLIAWLDASSEEQRRMRDIIRLFSDRDSRDELGLGQIRDAIGDGLFPGTSTLLTRARYLLFVPWVYQKASGRPNPIADADRYEREVIHAVRATDDYAGLLGMVAGVALKNLPSSVYWTMLRHYRILGDPSLTREDALRLNGLQSGADDADGARGARFNAWSTTIPAAPEGFPKSIEGGFALRREEAEWLRDRVLDEAPGTVMAHLAIERPSSESRFAWADDAALHVQGDARFLLDHARAFSSAIHGAQLLYNLMLAEEYEAAGFEGVANPVDTYRDRLLRWAENLPGLVDLDAWNLDELLLRVELIRNSPISPRTRRFVSVWLDLLRENDDLALADNAVAREFVLRRERQNKGAQARIGNPRRLQGWGGGSGSGALEFRWPTVRGILLDIHDGLAREPGGTDA